MTLGDFAGAPYPLPHTSGPPERWAAQAGLAQALGEGAVAPGGPRISLAAACRPANDSQRVTSASACCTLAASPGWAHQRPRPRDALPPNENGAREGRRRLPREGLVSRAFPK
jgi:hypothetical protein